MAGDLQALRAASASLSNRATEPAPAQPQTVGENLGAGVVSGLHQTAGMFYGLAALAGEQLGNKDLEQWGWENAKRKEHDAQEWAPRIQSLKDINTVGDFIDWSAGQIGQMLPTMGVSLGSGAIGAKIGQKVVQKKLRDAVTMRAVEKLTAQGIAKATAEKAVARAFIQRGAVAGAYAGSAALNTGDLYAELRDAGVKDAPQWAVGGGAIMGALDTITEAKILDDVVEAAVKKQVTGSLLKAAGKEMAKVSVIEGTTEGAQEAVAIATHALADPKFDPTSDANIQRVLDATAAGAIMGVVMGPGSAVGQRLAAGKLPQKDGTEPGSEPPPAGATPPPAARSYGGEGEGLKVPLFEAAGVKPSQVNIEQLTAEDVQDSLDRASPAPGRYIGAFGTAASDTDAFELKPYNGDSDALTKKLASLQAGNPEFDYEKVDLGDGKFAIAEYAKDVGGARSTLFDPKTQTSTPVAELVDETLRNAANRARRFNTRTTEGKAQQTEFTSEFEFFSEDSQGTKAIQRKPLRLALKDITRLGRALDNDHSGNLIDHVRRQFSLGMAELMNTPTLRKGSYGEELMYARPVGDIDPNAIVFEGGTKGGDSVVIRYKDLKTSGIDPESLDAYRHSVNLDREYLGDPVNTKGMGAPDVWARDNSRGLGYESGDGAVADEYATNSLIVDRTPEEPRQDGKVLVRDDVTGQEQVKELSADGDAYDPSTEVTESADYQAEQAGRAAQFPTAVPNKQLGVQRPGSTRAAPAQKYTGFARTLSNILTEFSAKFNIPRVGLMNINTAQLATLRDPKASAEAKAKALDELINVQRLRKRLGPGADVIVDAALKGFESGADGFVLYLGDQEVVFVDPTLPQARQLRILAHELGHSVTERYYNALDAASRQKLQDAWRNSNEANGGKRGGDFYEWMAEQFVAWQARRSQARAPVERWFGFEAFLEKTSEKLRELWSWLTKNHGLDQTFAEFMDGVAATNNWDLAQLKYGRVNDFTAAFGSLGVAADPFWSGLPLRRNFTPPKDVKNAVAARLRPWLQKYAVVAETGKGFGDIAMQLHNNLFASVDGILKRMKNGRGQAITAFSEDLRQIFHKRAGDKGGYEFQHELDAVHKRMNKNLRNAWYYSLKDRATTNGKFDAAEFERLQLKLVETLLANDGKKDGTEQFDPDVEPEARDVKRALKDARDLAVFNGLPIGEVPNYFMHVFDHELLDQHEADVLAILQRHGYTADEAVKQFYRLKDDDQVIDTEYDPESERDVGDQVSPVAQAARHRKLTPALRAELRPYLVKNLSVLFNTYSQQLTRRTLFNRHFGQTKEDHARVWKQWADRRDALLTQWRQVGDPRGNLGQEDLADVIENEIGAPPRYNPIKKWEELLARAKEQGATDDQVEEVTDLVGRLLGRKGLNTSQAFKRVTSQIMLYQNVRLLSFTVLGALGDLMMPALRMRAVGPAFRAMIKSRGADKAWLDKMMNAYGVAVETMNDHIIADGMPDDPQIRKTYMLSEKFFKYTGVQAFERFGRRYAIQAGIDYIIDAADKGDTEALGELGLTADDVKDWVRDQRAIYGVDTLELHQNQTATSKARAQRAYRVMGALTRFMHEAKVSGISRASKSKLMNDARFLLVSQLKAYAYEFQGRILNRIWYDLNKTNITSEQLRFLMPMILSMALVGFGLELRELLQYGLTGDEPRTDKMSGLEYIYTMYQRSGFFGIGQFATDAVEAAVNGRAPLMTITGPTVTQISDAALRDWERSVTGAIPVLNNFTGVRTAATEWLRE